MTINYTTLLGLAKPVTGTEAGTWGDTVNDAITSLIEDAVANAATISVTGGDVTLTTTNGASNQARMSTLILTGTPGVTRNIIAPSQSKIYVVINQSNSSVVIKGAATGGVTVATGQTAHVAWNGTDFVEIGNYVNGNFTVNGALSVNGNVTLGNATSDTVSVSGAFSGRIDPRVSSTASASSVTPDVSAYDMYAFTALAATLTINAPTGTPVNGDKLMFRILDNGTSQTLSWNATYTSIGAAIPTATVINKTTYVGCIYNAAATRWDVIASITQG